MMAANDAIMANVERVRVRNDRSRFPCGGAAADQRGSLQGVRAWAVHAWHIACKLQMCLFLEGASFKGLATTWAEQHVGGRRPDGRVDHLVLRLRGRILSV
jgi:hypothetical protein